MRLLEEVKEKVREDNQTFVEGRKKVYKLRSSLYSAIIESLKFNAFEP